MQNASQNLAYFGNFAPGEFQFAQSRLEQLEAFRIVDANPKLRGVTEISPSFLGRPSGILKTQVRLLSSTGAGKEVIEDVEVALASRDICYAAPFETVIEQFTTE